MKIRITYPATVIIAVLLLFIGHRIAVQGLFIFMDHSQEHVRARVLRITERVQPGDLIDTFDDSDEFGEYDEFFISMMGETVFFEAELRSGARKGQIITAEQSLNNLMLFTPKEVIAGDSVMLINTDIGWFFNGHIRTNRLLGLGVLFTLCVLFFGGKKGFNTILSLGLTCAAVFTVFIPSILSGKNIYLMAVLVCIYTTITTLLLVVGYNKKSLGAATGCISGIVVAGLITIIMDKALLLTGIVDEHSRHLANLPIGTPIDLKAIIFAGITIGAMGAIMDVAMSIASSLWEVKEEAETVKFENLFRSGLNIGRDIMGSMANTLILAYIGSSLSVVLILTVYSGSVLELLNREMIVVEILQALAGSLGILCAMPLTAFFCASLYLTERKKI